MKNISVTYILSESQEQRLNKIAEEYRNKYSIEITDEDIFIAIMCIGSCYDVDSKLKFHEWKLGLREDCK